MFERFLQDREVGGGLLLLGGFRITWKDKKMNNQIVNSVKNNKRSQD